MLYELLAVFAGGGIGAVTRYLMTLGAGRLFGMTYVGTFAVNIIGCFAIGYILGLTLNKTALKIIYNSRVSGRFDNIQHF